MDIVFKPFDKIRGFRRNTELVAGLEDLEKYNGIGGKYESVSRGFEMSVEYNVKSRVVVYFLSFLVSRRFTPNEPP